MVSGQLFVSGKNNNEPAFTIVELLIVIVIVGILAAIITVSYVGISKKATEAGLTSDLDGAKRQLELYKTENELYPITMDENECPINPVNDTKYCLKNKSFEYTGSADGSTYSLKLTKSGITYEATNDSTPKEAAAVVPDWITIGAQTWATKNLNVGTMIADTTNALNNGIVEKYCYDNDPSNCDTYGGLYTWDEMMQYNPSPDSPPIQGVCLAGSHLPSDNDWKILEIHLGMTQEQADDISLRGTDQSMQLREGGTSELNLQFAGQRANGGGFNSLGTTGNYWTSTPSAGYPIIRRLFSANPMVARNEYFKPYGNSVRCIKD